MLYLIIEREYGEFAWGRRSLRSLQEEVRKRRMTVPEIRSLEEIPRSDEEAYVVLMGSTEAWHHYYVREAGKRGIHPIALTCYVPVYMEEPFSSVMQDAQGGVSLAVNYLRSLGRRRLALLGVNPSSSSDSGIVRVFRYLKGNDDGIFENVDSVRNMFRRFERRIGEFDGVICTNDYVAIALVHYLQTIGVDPTSPRYVVGYGGLNLTHMCSPSITSVSDDMEHIGQAVISLYQLLVKNPTITSASVLLGKRLYIRETTGNEPWEGRKAGEGREILSGTNMFYQDEEIAEMAKLEVLLCRCDETDLAVIECLMNDDTYAAIAEKCFISETAVKYRVQNMKAICGLPSREALVGFFRKIF